MFEAAFIKKYLTPKRKQLSSSLIALLSIGVITVVVWLVVLFLSVTEGIEKSWLDKLTSLNAPVRIKPTEAYFASYYYNVDRYSAASHYLSKSLGQKARALLSDPHDSSFDESLPLEIPKPERLANGQLLDPVKELTGGLSALGLNYQDVEMSGALLRLDLIRKEPGNLHPAEMKSQLTNVSYLASFPSKNPALSELLVAPTVGDLNNLLHQEMRTETKDLSWLENVQIQTLAPRAELWKLPIDLLPEKTPFAVEAYHHGEQISHLLLPTSDCRSHDQSIERRGDRLFFKGKQGAEIPLEPKTPIFSLGKLDLAVEGSIEKGLFAVSGLLQEQKVAGRVPLEGLEVKEASFQTMFVEEPKNPPHWPFFTKMAEPSLPEKERGYGILLAKSYHENGVRMGDCGYLAYSSPSLSGTKELHLPVYIAGFYDPGIMAVGNKCILVPPSITESINRVESPYTLEKSEANQYFVWLKNLKDTQKTKGEILQMLEDRHIGKYFTVETFHDYEFAKPLMQQFQSDKYLFTLIGIIILLVACTNIISLLAVLVSDKKKEIGILRAMGARRSSIVAIFACSGGLIGLMSCLLGLLLGWLTLHNIDHVVHLLSALQGHDAFNTQFFGTSLPHTVSPRALLFAAIATPCMALLSGLIPAIKAARLDPCNALRSE